MKTTINTRGCRARLLAMLLVSVLGPATAASAYWRQPGAGSASGHVATLAAPTITGASAGAGTVALSWSAVTAPASSGAVSYYVSRDGGSPASACPSSVSPAAQTSCTDNGVPAGSHSYTVNAVWRSWTAKSASVPAQLSSGAATHLLLTPATTSPTAGVPDNLTITAKDASENTVGSYTGAKNLTFSGASTIGSLHPTVSASGTGTPAFGSPTAIGFSGGVATVSGSSNGAMTLYKAETASIKVSDGTLDNGSGVAVTVAAGEAESFVPSTPTAQVAGAAFSETILARDSFGNTATSYSGPQTLSFSGPAASPNSTAPKYPASVSFTAGSGKASIALYDASPNTTLTVTQGTSSGGSISGSSASFAVAAAAAGELELGAASSSPTAAASDNLTITALDPFGNSATSYTGSKSLTFGGAATIGSNHPTVSNASGSPISFGNSTTISFSGGLAKVSGTNNGVMRAYKAESTKITVSDGSIGNGSGLALTVGAAPLSTLSVSNPGTQTAGVAFSLPITAKDTYGNAVSGSQAITFSGPGNAPDGTTPSYPASVSFNSGGEGKASLTLSKAQSTTLTAALGTIKGTSGSFSVSAAAAAALSLSAESTTPAAGDSDELTITALDQFENTATSYTGSRNLTFGGAATIGSNHPTVSNASGTAVNFGSATAISFTNGVAKETFSGRNGVMKLYAAEAAQITVSDGTLPGAAGLAVTVGVGSLSSFSLTNPGAQTAGSAFNLTITAKDSYGNGLSGPQTLTFSGAASSPGERAPVYPSSVSFTAGVGTASLTLFDADSTTSVTAARGSSKVSTGNFAVNPAAAARLAWSAASSSSSSANEEGLCLFACTWSGIGKSHTWSAKVSVTDANGNVVSNLGAGHVVTWTPGPTGGGSVTPSSLTLPTTGLATTSSSVVYTSPNNNTWSSDGFTAHSSPYTDAQVILKK